MRKFLIAAVCGLVAAAIAGVAVSRLEPVHVATAVLRAEPPTRDATDPVAFNRLLGRRLAGLEAMAESHAGLSAMVARLNLYRDERNDRPMEDIYDEMRHASVFEMRPLTQGPGSQVLVSFRAADADTARAVAQGLAGTILDYDRQNADARVSLHPESASADLSLSGVARASILGGLLIGLLLPAAGAFAVKQPLAVFSGVLLAVVLGAVTWTLPPRFESHSMLSLNLPPAEQERIYAIAKECALEHADDPVFESEDHPERNAAARADAIRRSWTLLAGPSSEGTVLDVAYVSDDPGKAQTGTQILVHTLQAELTRENIAEEAVEVLVPASNPANDNSPAPLVMAVLGLLLGTVIGAEQKMQPAAVKISVHED